MNNEYSWRVNDEKIVECSLVQSPTVLIKETAYKKIKYIMYKMGKSEWACDLIGTVDCKYKYIIEDISIFEQVVTAVSVERIGQPHPDSIGVLHSHHDMGLFFSDCDNHYANANWQLAGVVDSKLNFKFTAKQQTPCGKICRKDVVIYIENDIIPVDLSNIKVGGVYGNYKCL